MPNPAPTLHQKALAVLCLAFALLLASCGRAAVITTAPETTPAPTTTEATTTTKAPFLPVSGESNGVRWRTLDLKDEANAEVKAWLEKSNPEAVKNIKEWPMGKDKTVIKKEEKYHEGKLILRDHSTGKETVLLEDTYIGFASDNPYQDDVHWKRPVFLDALDDRYFLFIWGGWEWHCGYGIFDTKDLREISINYNDEMFVNHGILYSYETSEFGGYIGPLHLWKYDWRAIVRGESLKAVDVLADFSGPDAEWDYFHLLTSDTRYFIAANEISLCIYDLAEKKLLAALPRSAFAVDYLGPFYSEWNGAVYWHEVFGCQYALEITLP
jgi:hypothetical protein